MTLADTSVWIDHFRRGNARLERLLNEGVFLHHTLIFGEIACGNLHKRAEILKLRSLLPQARLSEFDETIRFLESRRLFGPGLGWIDIHLLASTQLTGCRSWTLDKMPTRAAKNPGLCD
jgi:hypothetical protein